MAQERVDIVLAAKDLYTRELARAKRLFTQTGQRITTVFKAGTLAVAGYGAALGAVIKTTANAGDAFHKMSLRTGVSSQALSELAHAAEISGASIEDVEKGFKTLSKRMSDASFGLETYERVFRELNIEYKDASGSLRDVDAVFMDSVAAINSLTSETQKAALAQELFGRAGTTLLPLMKEGQAGIAALREEARLLGITFDDRAAASAAAFNDELTRTKAALVGAKNTLALEFMPQVTAMAEGINQEFIDLRASGEIDKWAKGAADTAIDTFESITLGAASMADLLSPIVRGTYGEVKFIWDQYQTLPTWAKEVGLVGAFLGGKKGAIVLGASLHLIGTVKNQLRALEEIGKGTLTLSEFATSNAGELAAKLAEIDAGRQGKHPLSLIYGGGLDDLPAPETFAGKVEAYFAKVRALVDAKRDALAGGAGDGGAGGGTDPLLAALGLGPEVLTAGTFPGELAELASMERRLDAIADFHTSKIIAITDAAEREKAIAQASAQFSAQTDQLRLASYVATASMMSNTLQSLFVATGSTNKALFAAYKTFAVGQAIISAELGAAKALGQGGIWGIPFSALIRGMGYANAAVIAAQAMTGSAGASRSIGGGGTVSTGSPAPVTPSGAMLPAPRPIDTRPTQHITVYLHAMNPADVDMDRFVENNLKPAMERLSDSNAVFHIQVDG